MLVALALCPIQGGTLFEAAFSLLDGIKANVILCKQQYLAAPLHPDGKLLPMVIHVRGPRISCPCGWPSQLSPSPRFTEESPVLEHWRWH